MSLTFKPSFRPASQLLADRANEKPRPLSSQPKRNWGDEEEDDRPAFQLTAEEWPPSPSPPKKRSASVAPAVKSTASGSRLGGKDSFSGSVSSHSANTTGAKAGSNSWSNTDASSTTSKLAKPLTAQSSFRTGTSSSSAGASRSQGSIAPMFMKAPSSHSSTSAAFVPVPGPSKKRLMPWEVNAAPQPKAASRSGSSNFHTVGGTLAGGGSGNGFKSKMLTSSTMDIKQKVILSPEQQMVLKLVVEDGKNVFFTGSAGTGKSVLLREIIASLKRKYSSAGDAVAVTASTGMAACNIGGTTIHSFSGIGLGIEEAEFLINKVRKQRTASGKWSRTKVLVIDEVSMVDGFLFDKLAAIAKAIRKKPGVPFGGIQLVITGDFFQLPPVAKGVATFAFEAKAWKETIEHTVNLTQVFRQKDTEFIDMLNEMRFGTLSAESIAKFKALSRTPRQIDGLVPTELFPKREEVEKANQARLAALGGDKMEFVGEDWPSSTDGRPNSILANFMAPQNLVLKIGAQVMLIKNMDANLVNGTIGRVIGFGVPDIPDEEDGMNDPDANARKRARMMESKSTRVVELAPQIEWNVPGGMEIRVMAREEFKTEDNKGMKTASRKQYPIILAWAMSIHKSQGQTLPCVKVDLGKVFEKGQSYVALSRATCLEGLQVLRFDAKKVEAHPKVVAWSKTLKVLS